VVQRPYRRQRHFSFETHEFYLAFLTFSPSPCKVHGSSASVHSNAWGITVHLTHQGNISSQPSHGRVSPCLIPKSYWKYGNVAVFWKGIKAIWIMVILAHPRPWKLKLYIHKAMIIISAWVGGASLHILVPYQETCITSVVASFNLNTYTYNHTGDPLAHSPLYFPYVIYTYLRLVKAPRCWVIMMHACWMQMDCQSCHSHPLTSKCWMCMWLYLTLHYKSVAYTQETNIIIFLFMFYISW